MKGWVRTTSITSNPAIPYSTPATGDVLLYKADGGAYATTALMLHQKTWAPSVDAAAGLTLLVAELRGQHSPLFGFWLTAEGGYGYSGGHEVALSTQAEAPAGRTDAPTRFGTLAVRGAFTRFGLSLTF